MTYQGARARPEASEVKRVFAVHKVRLDAKGRVGAVLWGEVDARANADVGASVVVPVADVVDAIHDGARVVAVFPASAGQGPRAPDLLFELLEHDDGSESVTLSASHAPAGAPGPGLQDLARLDD